MSTDAFSKRHPLVNFIFFLGAIGFGIGLMLPFIASVLWERHTARKRRARRQARAARRAYREVAQG